MFHAAMQAELHDAFQKSPFDKLSDEAAADVLPKALTALANWATAEQRVRLLRTVTAEGTRFPHIAAAYNAALTGRIIAPLKAFLDAWIDRGQIDRHDSEHSARQLVAIVMGQVQQHAIMTGSGLTREQLVTCARAGADLFLRGHAGTDQQAV
ncbi:TetR/AcrR family transcriptional regulator C-terminal domain-containing protein (plasmid) [Paracoccus marcusii]|uniref:TetR/AcrR family transcriptional regulator C-terminal domain-containing protein n=1 Tax=Paracoccus marcusii TaxID=59779 RepID=UPI0038BB463F